MYWSGETATTTKKDKKRKKKRKKEEKKERVTGGGGGGTTVIVQFDTLDMKASRVGASTTSMGSEFQSLIVFGRKEEQTASGRLFHSGMVQTEKKACCRRDTTLYILAAVSLVAGSTGSCGRACPKRTGAGLGAVFLLVPSCYCSVTGVCLQ